MRGRTVFLWMSMAGFAFFGASAVLAQSYPNKPVRIITAAAGGGTDFASRLIAPGLASSLGQPFVVENHPSGVILGMTVAKAPPDGYTLLLNGNTFWFGPLMQEKMPYDPMIDFAPITTVTSSPNVLVVPPSLPVKSVKDLIALAKARPGELNYASPALGSSPHLAAELFKSMAGVSIMRIGYKGNAQALTDVMSGRVHLTFAVAGAVRPLIKSGKVRALAITSARPSALFEGLLPVAESGLPGYEMIAVLGVFAPGKTPVAIIRRLNQEIKRVLEQPEVRQKFLSAGVEPMSSSPEELAAIMKSEMAKFGKIIKGAGKSTD